MTHTHKCALSLLDRQCHRLTICFIYLIWQIVTIVRRAGLSTQRSFHLKKDVQNELNLYEYCRECVWEQECKWQDDCGWCSPLSADWWFPPVFSNYLITHQRRQQLMDRPSIFICVSTYKHLCCVWKYCVSRSTCISFQVLSKNLFQCYMFYLSRLKARFSFSVICSVIPP